MEDLTEYEEKQMVIKDCDICKSPSVASINEDLIAGINHPSLCARNNLEYSQETVSKLLNHYAEHVVSPSQSLANYMIHEEAIELKNTIIETNQGIDFLNMLLTKMYIDLEGFMEDKDRVRLYDSIIKGVKEKGNLVKLLHDLSGKKSEDELKKATLNEILKQVGEHLGQDAVDRLKKKKGESSVEEVLIEDPHIRDLINNGKTKKSKS